MRAIVKWMARVATVSAALVWFGAASSEAQVQIDLSPDQRVLEGNGLTPVPFTANLSASWPLTITVNWRTVAGSATSPGDFVTVASGVLSFSPGNLSQPLNTVQVQGDATPEWSSTLQQDQVFFVELFNPVNATIRRGRATVTIVDDDTVQPGAQYLSAVTDSTGTAATDGRNRLQWRVPAAPTAPSQFQVCWKASAASCTSPLSNTDTAGGGCSSMIPALTPMSKMLFTHDNTVVPKVTVGMAYCYSVFTIYGGPSPERAEVAVKTFDSTPANGPVRWTFSAGHYAAAAAASVVPPTVGIDGVYSVGTDGVVQAMTRGDTGGLWPGTWNPVSLNTTFVAAAHNRSPVVTLPTGPRFFVGTENGEVHAVDAKTGSIVWSRAAGFPVPSQQLMTGSTGTQAIPAGLFKTFGGLNDLLLVGTATAIGNTQFFALDPASGATLDSYPTGGDTPPGLIDNVFGMATVDYATNRVYFGASAGGALFTLWSLDLGPSGAPDLKLTTTVPWNPKGLGITGGTTGSPVARNGRLYLGTDNGAASAIHSLRVSDGQLYSYTHGDGQVKGFAWPDRRDGRLYFSTVGKVHGVNDNGTGIAPLAWSPLTVPSPSIPLQKPGTDYLYVGDGTGRLLEIDASTGLTINSLQLDTGAVQIGAPSLDGPNSLLLVGSDKGVIYAVHVPF